MVEDILNTGNGSGGPGGSVERPMLYLRHQEVRLASLLLEHSRDISPNFERKTRQSRYHKDLEQES